MCSLNMREKKYSQLELFSPSKDSLPVKTGILNPFLSYVWNYEKTILIIICFIITGIVSFSLGVEKGKRITMLKSNSNLDIATGKQISPFLEKTDTQQPLTTQPQTPLQLQNYTIQVATYQTKTHAQIEAEALRKKGLLPLVLSKSGYTVLCVGNFSNQGAAKSLLSELKKRYRDCFIRRL